MGHAGRYARTKRRTGRGASPARPATIEVRDLTKQFHGVRVVDGLSFTVTPGKITGFLGPNGAGKTTTIRALLGLAKPDSGDTRLFGKPYRELGSPLSRVGVLIDGSAFHPRRSARAHLRALAAAGNLPRGRVDEVLAEVELADVADRKVGEFSLGMRQRLGLAAALLGDPDLLVLDEPANGLDPAGMRWLRRFLQAFAASGRTVFVSSHVLAEMAEMADEVVVINKGRLVTHTTVEGLTAATSVTVRSAEPERLLKVLVAAGGSADKDGSGRIEVTDLASEEIGEIAAREGLVLHELTPRTNSLEEVFLQLTDAKGEAR